MNHLHQFESYRSFLFALAYQMLGTVSEAEDMVQETFLKWQQVTEEVNQPKSYLGTIITRLCLDRWRSLKRQREKYTGVWLPEPLVDNYVNDPAYLVELADSLSLAFLVLLEDLTPTERAVFLLKEVFNYKYAEISQIVAKKESNCRQIAKRARQSLQTRHPAQVNISGQERELLVEKFLTAWNDRDLEALLSLLQEDVIHYSDGGGKVTAALNPIQGKFKVARFLIALRNSKIIPDLYPSLTTINNQPGIIIYLDNRKLHSILSFDIQGDCFGSIFAVVNPEKLKLYI